MPVIQITREELLRSKVLDPGWYPVVVKEIGVEPAKSDGSTNYVLKMVVLGENGKDVPLQRYYNEKAIGMMSEYLEACGAKIDIEKGISVDVNTTIGKKIQAHVSNRLYEGRLTNNVDGFRPL